MLKGYRFVKDDSSPGGAGGYGTISGKDNRGILHEILLYIMTAY